MNYSDVMECRISAVDRAEGLVRDRGQDAYGFAFSERHLRCAWYDMRVLPVSLETWDGERVYVRDPGRWNFAAGPDFLDARLELGPGRRSLVGDVEIHMRPSDWRAHGHTGDPGYGRVMAHVCWFDGRLEDGLPAGAVQISLRNALSKVRGFSFENLDVAAYPFMAVGGHDAFCGRFFRERGEPALLAFLESAGQARLRLKADRMRRRIAEDGEEQALYVEVLAALGYKQNATACRRLGTLARVERLREAVGGDVLGMYALLLGIAGLLPNEAPRSWDGEARTFLRTLWRFWLKHGGEWAGCVMERSQWRLSGVRPLNSPVRRLAAAAELFGREPAVGSYLRNLDGLTPRKWFRDIAHLFRPGSALSFWRGRSSFASQVGVATELVGRERAAAIAVNVFLPYLSATGVDVSALAAGLPPEQENSITRQMTHSLFGRDLARRVKGGLRQQGLLQVFHDFCLAGKTGCVGCAFGGPEFLTGI